MSKLVIADLEHSIELDREAMRVIMGLGTRPSWPSQSVAFFLLHTSKNVGGNATGLRAAASRWSDFLRGEHASGASLMHFSQPGRTHANGSKYRRSQMFPFIREESSS